MTLAVQKVRMKEMKLSEAAEKFGLPKSTLFRRVHKDGQPAYVASKGLGRFRWGSLLSVL